MAFARRTRRDLVFPCLAAGTQDLPRGSIPRNAQQAPQEGEYTEVFDRAVILITGPWSPIQCSNSAAADMAALSVSSANSAELIADHRMHQDGSFRLPRLLTSRVIRR